MAGPACAGCGSGDIKKLAAIVSGGTWSGRSETDAGGVAFGTDGSTAIGVGGASTSHAGGTALARTLAPPRRPGPAGTGRVLLAAGALGAVFSLLTWGITSQGDRQTRQTWAPILVVAIVATLGAVALAIAAFAKDKVRLRAATEDWEELVSRWQQLWYCDKCHSVSDLVKGKAVPAQAYREVLLPTLE
jgi:hypothetical protein